MAIKPSKPMLAAHTAGIFADMTLDGPEIGTLIAVIDRAKNLPNRKTMGKQNPYCAMRLGKEAKKTETDKRGGQTPKWDQELRFIVHESPDYYKLKCSIFNDDKKTDLIGEAWINLSDLIKPGGGSNDLWHQLNYKGKYAGDIRIELTYYDMRPREEKAQEKKKAREKVPTPPVESTNAASGPRQLGPRDVRRRPLPTNPADTKPTQTTPVSTPPVSTPQEETPPRPPKIPHSHHARQLPLPAPSQQPPIQPPVQEDQYNFDPYANEFSAVQPLAQQQYRQPYYEEQPYTPDVEGPDSFDMVAGHDEEQEYASYDQQMVVRQNPSSLPQHAWPDEVESWDQSQRRRSHQYPGSDTRYQSSPRSLPSPPVHSDPNQHHSPRSSLSPIKSGSYRDSPLRHSMNQQEASVDMVDEPESYDAPPPPPPKHRETTPRRQQPEYPPSAFVQQESNYGQHSSNSNRSTPRRLSVDERSPLQSIEREFDPFTNPNAVSNQSIKRRSFCEPYHEETETRRQSYSNRIEYHAPERHSSYDAYHDLDFSHVSSEFHHQEPYHSISQPQPSQRPQHRDRSSSYDDRYSMPESAQQFKQLPGPFDYSNSQPDLPITTYHKPQPVRPRPQNQNQTPPRKAINSGPYPEPIARRLSDQPFNPDAYDVLNPASSPITNENTIFQTPEQAKEAARIRLAEKLHDDAPIIGNDGRVIDPSDHLPSDTWAPEPEKKQRKPEHVIHYRTRNDVRPNNSPNSAPSSARTSYPNRQRQPQSLPMSSPASGTPPGARNRLQKVPSPNRPLPQQPYQMTLPEPSPPPNSGNQQAVQRYSYQETSPTVHRPSLSEYQVPVSNSHAGRRSSYRDDYASPSQPHFNSHAGGDYSPSYVNGYHDSLAAEMSMIDIGPSRGSRAMVRSGQRF